MGPESSRRNVLIVEGDPDIRSLIRGWLDPDPRCGMIWEAADPLTAGGLSAILPVDAVIIDHLLDGGVASDCLATLRTHRPESLIVVYAADTRLARAAHVLEQGADHLVEQQSVVVEDVVTIVFGGDDHRRFNVAG